jgi:hypothetical protein
MELEPLPPATNDNDDEIIVKLYAVTIGVWIFVSVLIFFMFTQKLFIFVICVFVGACLFFNFNAKNHTRFELTSDMFVFSGIAVIASSLILNTSKKDTVSIALILASILSICLSLPRYNSVSKHRVLHFKNNCLIISIGLTLYSVISYFEHKVDPIQVDASKSEKGLLNSH